MTGVVNPTFLPWLRTGLATAVSDTAKGGLAPHDVASLSITVNLHAEDGQSGELEEPVDGPDIRLRSPGEIADIDETLVVRHDPAPGASDAESTYLALVEFGPPDLPWRYTPAAAGKNKLQPWLALVVVEDRDGVVLDTGGRPAVLHVDDAARELPDLAQCWAWAHVHTDADLAQGIPAALSGSPKAFRSRLLSPRHLSANRSWLACVVPTFEAGRRAGLGASVTPDMGLAWDVTAGGEVTLPVYHWWRFATGPGGDFESLVRRLQPSALPGSVGRRPLDLSRPGGGLPEVAGIVVSYEGALLSPAGTSRPWPDAARKRTKVALASILNAELTPTSDADPYDALDDDPVVGPPAYAINQAGVDSVPALDGPPVWLGELNTEPPHRAVAAVGAAVVRRDQEALMAEAWQVAGDTRAATAALASARAAWELARGSRPAFDALSDPVFVQLAAPAMARLTAPQGSTVEGVAASSALPDGLLSGTFRRVTRTAPSFSSAVGGVSTEELVTRTALDDTLKFVGSWADVAPPAGSGVEGGSAHARRPPALSAASPVGPQRDGAPLAARSYTLATPTRADWAVLTYTGDVDAVGTLVGYARTALDPLATIRAMVDATVSGLDADRTSDVPDRVLIGPAFSTPAYSRVAALSIEYLVPGAADVPGDTLGLLEANQSFVEALLAGMNHELWREFVWREFPAQPTDTWLTHFWDGAAPDIDPIASWKASAGLGANAPSLPAPASLVMLIRSVVLQRYPDLRVYAVPARWQGTVRVEGISPLIKTPVFVARLAPDVAAFGFDLDQATARGTTHPADGTPGWFFVLEQVPSAPRFGLDAPRNVGDDALTSWDGLSWSHLADNGGPLPDFIDVTGPSSVVTAGPLPGNGPTHTDLDAWGEDAAAMARITFQRPVRMLVHASAMLPPVQPSGHGAG